MIELTPLDVRKKKGDFAKGLRGYDPQEVDQFLDLVSERLEGLVKENLDLQERVDRLSRQVQGSEGREKAVQEALITAQELREEIRDQARREAELLLREVESDARRTRQVAEEEARKTLEDVDRNLEERRQEIRELSRARERFLRSFRHLLEREMDVLEAEADRDPLEGFPSELLGMAKSNVEETDAAEAAPGPGGDERQLGRGEEGGAREGRTMTVTAGRQDSAPATDDSSQPSDRKGPQDRASPD